MWPNQYQFPHTLLLHWQRISYFIDGGLRHQHVKNMLRNSSSNHMTFLVCDWSLWPNYKPISDEYHAAQLYRSVFMCHVYPPLFYILLFPLICGLSVNWLWCFWVHISGCEERRRVWPRKQMKQLFYEASRMHTATLRWETLNINRSCFRSRNSTGREKKKKNFSPET